MRPVGRSIDDSDDLLTADQVAQLLGLTSGRAISVYRQRFADFPTPEVARGGRVVLWLRQDVEAWRAAHPARRRSDP